MQDLRVLLVDDSTTFLDALENLLLSWKGIQVVARASSGHDAVRVASETELDLVLCDLQMPGIDGLATTRLLKSIRPSTCVIVMALYDDAGFHSAALDAGADAYLPKSGFPELLRPLIDQLCQR